MSDSLINFFAAGFDKSLEELKNQNQKNNLETRELLMSLFDKLTELSGKSDALAGLIATEKAQATEAFAKLQAEIEALKSSVATLQSSVDAGNADAVKASELVDAQVAKLDAASTAVSEIIS